MLCEMNDFSAGVLGWMPGPWEIALIVLIVLLLFGGRKLPELARGLGKGMREFRRELRGVKKDLDEDDTPPENESHADQPDEENKLPKH